MPAQLSQNKTELLERMVALTEFGDCWEFMGARLPFGYGRIYTGKNDAGNSYGEAPHRLIWEMVMGPIPEGHHIDHLCKNPPCWNPEHLEPVTPTENQHRSKRKSGRYVRPAACKNGHDLSGDNWSPPAPTTGTKYRCKVCHRTRVARYRATQKVS